MWQLCCVSPSFLYHPITASTASHRLCSLSCRSPLSDRSSAETAAAARWGQNLSPTSSALSSLLSRWGSQSAGTSSSQLSISPFFMSMCSFADVRAEDWLSFRSMRVWMLNFGVLPNVQSQLCSSAANLLWPGNADSSAGSTRVSAELKPNSESQNKRSIYIRRQRGVQ